MYNTLGTQLILGSWEMSCPDGQGSMSCPDGQLVTAGRLFPRKRWTRRVDFESSTYPASTVVVMTWQPYHTSSDSI